MSLSFSFFEYMICSKIHGKIYKDAYESKTMLIYIDGIRFSLQYMGMKYCHRCGMFTALEPSKLCKCCHKGMKRSSKNYYRKRTRYENEDDSRWEKVPITIQELRYYASMIGEGYPTWTKERKKEEGYNCLSPR